MRRLAPLALLFLASQARAHQSSNSYSSVRVADDGEIAWSLALSTRDLYEALGLDSDRDATDEEIRAGEAHLVEYVLARVRFRGEGDRGCEVAPTGVELTAGSERRVELRFLVRCPTPGKVYLAYDLFFDLDPRHTGWLTISQGGTTIEDRFKKGAQEREINVKGGLGLTDMIAEGVEHIFTGYDHMAFLLGLLLVAAIRRQNGGWAPRGLKPGAIYVAKIVTAFTIAHSITLILAALGVIELSTRFVESAIAASIVWVAVENIIVGDPRWRWPLTFAFGLVHGLGFASVLRPSLPPRGVVLPLLAFNVGVELGQLAVVAVTYPILHAVASRGADRYRKSIVIVGSAAVGLLGMLWLVERVADIPLLSRILE